MIVSIDTLDIMDEETRTLEQVLEEIPEILTEQDVVQNGVIIEIIRDRKILSLSKPSYVRKHVLCKVDPSHAAMPADLLRQSTGITLGPRPLAPSFRHEWDNHKPRIVLDPGYVR